MRKIYLLAFILCAYSFVYAQKIYNVGEFHFKMKSGHSANSSKQGGSYIILSTNSEGKGEYTYIYDFGLKNEHYSEDEVEYVYIKNRKIKDVTDEERAALMALYHATDGPHWLHNEGWGEDCLVAYWYGVSATRMLSSSDLESHITNIDLANNNLTGTLPKELSSLKELRYFDITHNKLSGDFPEHPFSELMNQLYPHNFIFFCNDFTLPLPEWVKSHDKFWEYYPDFCTQNSYINSGFDWNKYFKDLQIPGSKYILTDMDGNIHKHIEDYPNNKLTILYKYTSWCPFSKVLTPKLVKAYNKYKDAGLKVLGLVNLNSDNKEDLIRYIADNGITWSNVPLDYASGSREHLDWDDEETNYYFSMEYSGVPALDAVNQQGELILPWIKDYNDIIPIIEDMFGPVDTQYYTSTDYSHDGEVMKLQSATEGKGLDLVFLGEAFVDKDMAPDGKYEQKMKEAMEQFFSVEPYISMRNRFNVYTVKVVSPNEEFAADAKHTLNTNDSIVFEYAKNAVGENADRMLVGVVYNTDYEIDRSFCHTYLGDGSFVAYLMDGVSSVLNHEMGGHGIAQLKDEYVEPGNETLTIPEEAKANLEEIWQTYGAGANVDYHSNASTIKWSHFLKDSRYADEVGIFEGAYLYGMGAYRPSENSMMRHNDLPFNAPSRESIYKHVMTYTEDHWTYDYETFAEFDVAGRKEFSNILQEYTKREPQRRIKKQQIGTAPPLIKYGTWRDAINNRLK